MSSPDATYASRRYVIWTALVVLLAASLAAIWLVRMPLLQAMDEQGHADYALELFDAARPFTVERPEFKDSTSSEIRYLETRLDFFPLHRVPAARLPAGYGSANYFRDIDRAAPKPSLEPPPAGAAISHYAQNYPLGYYALAASVMWMAYSLGNGSLIAALYAARAIAVLALIVSLIACADALRSLGISPKVRALALGGVAVLPVVTWMCSYIQPDAIVFATVSLTFAAFLHWRRTASGKNTLLLVAATSATAFVKVHYAVVVDVAMLLGVIGETAFRPSGAPRRLKALALLAMTSFASALLATHFGIVSAMSPSSPPKGPPATASIFTALGYALDDVRSMFLGGDVLTSFWNRFGDLQTPYLEEHTPLGMTVMTAVVLLSSAAFIALLIRQLRVGNALLRVGRRSPRKAAGLALRDPILTAYALWIAFLCAVDAATQGGIFTEGRYFVPMLLPMTAITIYYLPRLIPRRFRKSASIVAASVWFGAGSTFACLGLLALHARYYEPSAMSNNHTFAYINRVTSEDGSAFSTRVLNVKAGTRLRISGSVGSIQPGPVSLSASAAQPFDTIKVGLGPRRTFKGIYNAHPFELVIAPGAGDYEIDLIVRQGGVAVADDWVHIQSPPGTSNTEP